MKLPENPLNALRRANSNETPTLEDLFAALEPAAAKPPTDNPPTKRDDSPIARKRLAR